MATFAEANRRIQAVKDANAVADKARAEATLTNLQAVKKRHSEPVLGLASNYATLVSDKKALVEAKDAKKAVSGATTPPRNFLAEQRHSLAI